MKHLLAFLCLLAAAATPMLADQVTLKNGDRVTGHIVKKDAKNLTVKSDQLGAVTIPWDQVATIQSDKPLTVVTGGNTVQGTLATSNGKVEVTTKDTKLSLDPGDVTALRDEDEEKAYERLQHPGWLQLWAGTASLGLAGAAGNAETLTFTSTVNASRTTNTDKTSIYFNSIRASAFVDGKNSETAEAVKGGWAYDHNITPRLFVNGFNDWEYDKFQDLDLRYVFGGGFGYHVVKGMRQQLDVLGGFDYSHATFTTPPTQHIGEYFLGDTYNLKINNTTTLVQDLRYFDDLSKASNYRLNADLSLNTKIAKWLTWNVALSDRYLNIPAPGRKTNDFLYSTGIGITFAR